MDMIKQTEDFWPSYGKECMFDDTRKLTQHPSYFKRDGQLAHRHVAVYVNTKIQEFFLKPLWEYTYLKSLLKNSYLEPLKHLFRVPKKHL